MHQKDNPHKQPTKVKRIKEEMLRALKNRKKIAANSPRSALKRKNKVEEGGALDSRMKRE
jgi:hypothetical protein